MTPKINEKILDGRLHIKQLIGQGSRWQVYLANLREGQETRQVVVKWPSQNLPAKFAMVHDDYHRECLVLSKINHPSVVKLIGTGKEQSTFYLIEEFLSGSTLADFIRRNGPLYRSPSETGASLLLDIARSLVGGLDAVHAQGIYHSDINPRNICFRNNSGRDPVLIDFGASVFNDLIDKEPNAATIRYSPPEMLGFLTCDNRVSVDLYSLGLTLYECVVGEHPFRGPNHSAVVASIMEEVPPGLKERCPGFPASLSNVIDRLIRKNPGERYSSANGLLLDLQICEGMLEDHSREFALGRGEHLRELNYKIPTVGRSEVKDKLENLIGLSHHQLALGFIGAPSGMGKTRVAIDACHKCSSQGFHISAAKFSEFERNVPLSTLNRILYEFSLELRSWDETRRNLWSSDIAAVLGDRGDAFLQRLPYFEDFLPSFPRANYRDPEQESAAFRDAYADFLLNLHGTQSRHLIFLDDVQWIDDSSLEVLQCILLKKQNASSAKSLILATYRSEEVSFTHPLQVQILSHLSPESSIILGALSLDETKELVQHLIDETSPQVNRLAEVSFHMTKGSPFYVYEFLKACIREGSFYRNSENNWIFDEIKASSIDIGQGLLNLVQDRLSLLPIEAFQLVQAAAAIGNDLDLRLIDRIYRAVVDKDPQARLLPVALDALRREHIIKSNKNSFAFFHDRIREASLANLSEPKKKKVHGLYVAWMLAENPSIESMDSERLFELAHHLCASDGSLPLDKSILLLHVAGDRALHLFAYHKALEYLQQARHMLDARKDYDYEHKLKLDEALGDACSFSESIPQAISLYETLLPRIERDSDRLRIYSKISQNYLYLLDYSASLEAGISGLRILGIRFIKRTSIALISLLWQIPWTMMLALSYRYLKRDREEIPAERRPEFDLKIAVMVPSFFTLPIPTVANLLPIIREQLRYKENEYQAMLWAYVGVVCSVTGLEKPARAFYQKGLKYFEKKPNPVSTAFIVFVEGYLLDFPTGRLAMAAKRVERTLKISTDIGETFWRYLGHQAQANIDHYGGETEIGPLAVDALLNVYSKTRFSASALNTVIKQKLLEGDTKSAGEFKEIVLDAGKRLEAAGITSIDSIYSFLSVAEYYLTQGLDREALPFARKSFWDVLLKTHRIAYCFFAAPFYASCLCRLGRTGAAFFPLTISWLNVFAGFKIIYPHTLYATGEWLHALGLERLGRSQIQKGYRYAHKRGWKSLAMEGRLLYARRLAAVEPDGALGVLKNVKSYYRERGYSFLEEQASLLDENIKRNLQAIGRLQEKVETTTSLTRIRSRIEYESTVEMFINISIIREQSQFAEVVTSSFIRCSGATSAVLFLMDHEQQRYYPAGAHGTSMDQLLLGDFAGAGVDRFFMDAQIQLGLDDSCIRRTEATHIRAGSAMLTPLRAGGELLGFMYIANKEIPGLFDKRTVSVLRPLAAQAAVALQNYRLIASTREINANLERLVAQRTQSLQETNAEMGSLLHHMSQGAFTVLSNGCINAQYSDQLEKLLETNEIALVPLVDLLRKHTQLSGETISQIHAFLGFTLGEDEMNFEVNASVLPRVCMSAGQNPRTLELEWVPIAVAGRVERILVCINDQTEVLRLKSEAESRNMELTIIGELIDKTPADFDRFMKHGISLILDHGIESSQERQGKGKPPHGIIKISLQKHRDDLIFQYHDDGRGLNIITLQSIAMKKGLIDSNFKGKPDDVAMLMFADGFSSAASVTTISGRGIGMSAVREAVEKLGGEIKLLLQPGSEPHIYSFALKFNIPVEADSSFDQVV